MAGARHDTRVEPAAVDHEIVISRVISAPRELVFEAFTEVRHLSRWWGPEGITTTTRAFEFRVGGEWDFVLHGPDGTDYPEWICWTEIAPPERIALLHGESRGDPRSLGRRWSADGREGVLQRVDVAGRLHRARVPRGVDGAAVDGTAAVDLPAAVLP